MSAMNTRPNADPEKFGFETVDAPGLCEVARCPRDKRVILEYPIAGRREVCLKHGLRGRAAMGNRGDRPDV